MQKKAHFSARKKRNAPSVNSSSLVENPAGLVVFFLSHIGLPASLAVWFMPEKRWASLLLFPTEGLGLCSTKA